MSLLSKTIRFAGKGAIYLGLLVLIYLIPALTILWLFTLLNLLIRESFPFSHFPMYSKFSDFTYYVFIADEFGEPIPLKENFGIRTTFLKKIYITEVRALNPKGIATRKLPQALLNEAGIRLLERVRSFPAARRVANHKFERIRLYQVNVTLEKGLIRREKCLIAEVRQNEYLAAG